MCIRDRSRTNVVEHIKHIYDEGELDENSTCRKFRQVRKEGNREVAREMPFYNLDMIISLGYRVKSSIATNFRRWATERLKEYMIKGFTMDDNRLKAVSYTHLDVSKRQVFLPTAMLSLPLLQEQSRRWQRNPRILILGQITMWLKIIWCWATSPDIRA